MLTTDQLNKIRTCLDYILQFDEDCKQIIGIDYYEIKELQNQCQTVAHEIELINGFTRR